MTCCSLPLLGELDLLVQEIRSLRHRCGNSVLALTIAAERAAGREDVRGPGTFLPALIDELALLTPEIISQSAKVEVDMLA